MSSAGLCQAPNSLPCVTPTGLSFISQSRWASVFNESHAQIREWVLTLCPVFFNPTESQWNQEWHHPSISHLACECALFTPALFCLLLWLLVLFVDSLLRIFLVFTCPSQTLCLVIFFKTRSSLLDRRARLWKGWKLLIFHGWYQHPALWMIMYDNIFS